MAPWWPVRAFWPFMPLPEVLPVPEPRPRPRRFLFLVAPLLGASVDSVVPMMTPLLDRLDRDQVGDLANHAAHRQVVHQLHAAAHAGQAQALEGEALLLGAGDAAAHL